MADAVTRTGWVVTVARGRRGAVYVAQVLVRLSAADDAAMREVLRPGESPPDLLREGLRLAVAARRDAAQAVTIEG